jgi:hypothetical protein
MSDSVDFLRGCCVKCGDPCDEPDEDLCYLCYLRDLDSEEERRRPPPDEDLLASARDRDVSLEPEVEV